MAYRRQETYLLPAPYATNCFDYSKIGCQSRRDCIDKCKVELNLKECNVLPTFINVDVLNDKDYFQENYCTKRVDNNQCENIYKSNDCLNQHYSLETLVNDAFDKDKLNFLQQNYPQYNSNLITSIDIVFHDYPDIIYTHSPQQHFIEFACYVGGVIALWTGFSIVSLYGYGITFFSQSNKQNHQSNQLNQTSNRSRIFTRNTRLNQIVNESSNFKNEQLN